MWGRDEAWLFKQACSILLLTSLLLATTLPSASSSLLLLKTFDGKQDVTGWLMSEKLDGVRGVWDGTRLLTKNGNPIHAPKYFIDALPPFALDGELWTKRNDFETIQSIVLRNNPDLRWSKIRYHIFDVPGQSGGLLTRLAVLKRYLQTNFSAKQVIQIIPQVIIKSKTHLKNTLANVVKLKGEGLVVRYANDAYRTGRSAKDLKVKQTQDAECNIVGYKEGKGKYKGMLGSIQCQTITGMIINIGTGFSLKQRKNIKNRLKSGEGGMKITYKYYGLTKKGKPKFPVFFRVRLNE